MGSRNPSTKKEILKRSIFHRQSKDSGRIEILWFSEKSQYELFVGVLNSECENIIGMQKTRRTAHVIVIASNELALVLQLMDRIGYDIARKRSIEISTKVYTLTNAV